jgi:hypothetical protein
MKLVVSAGAHAAGSVWCVSCPACGFTCSRGTRDEAAAGAAVHALACRWTRRR